MTEEEQPKAMNSPETDSEANDAQQEVKEENQEIPPSNIDPKFQIPETDSAEGDRTNRSPDGDNLSVLEHALERAKLAEDRQKTLEKELQQMTAERDKMAVTLTERNSEISTTKRTVDDLESTWWQTFHVMWEHFDNNCTKLEEEKKEEIAATSNSWKEHLSALESDFLQFVGSFEYMQQSEFVSRVDSWKSKIASLETLWSMTFHHQEEAKRSMQEKHDFAVDELNAQHRAALAHKDKEKAKSDDSWKSKIASLETLWSMTFHHQEEAKRSIEQTLEAEKEELTASLRERSQRIDELERMALMSFSMITNSTWTRLDEIEQIQLKQFATTNNHWFKIMDESTNTITNLQAELISEAANAAVVETKLTVELQNYEERIHILQADFLKQLALNANHDKQRSDELDEIFLRSFLRTTQMTASLQNELINETTRATLTEAKLVSELKDYSERFDTLSTSYFISLATVTNDHVKRTNKLQTELTKETTRATLTEAKLVTELNNYSERFDSLSRSYFLSLATTTNDWWARISELEHLQLRELATSTTSWYALLASLNETFSKSFVHTTLTTEALQNELIASTSRAALDKVCDHIIQQEKSDELYERGKMTANELELKTDKLNHAKEQIQMQCDDLEGYVGRRRELRDRMTNVSTVVRDWKSKIRNASSSILLAQSTMSKNYGKTRKGFQASPFGGETNPSWLNRDLERTYNYSKGDFQKILPM